MMTTLSDGLLATLRKAEALGRAITAQDSEIWMEFNDAVAGAQLLEEMLLKAAAERDAARARIAELEKALKPFADCADFFTQPSPAYYEDNLTIYAYSNVVLTHKVHPMHRLSVGKFRAAYDTLNAVESESD